MQKKGVELGFNVIIMAVIGLAVLIVVLIVFTGKFGLFSSTLNDCENTGKGICLSSGEKEDCASKYQGRIMDYKCPTNTDVCCVCPCSLAGGKCMDGSACSNPEKVLYASCGDGKMCCRP